MERARGFLAGMRVRKKLIFLHTAFSLTLALILTLATSTPLRSVVRELERDKALAALDLLGALAEAQGAVRGVPMDGPAVAALAERLSERLGPTAAVTVLVEGGAVPGAGEPGGLAVRRQIGPGVVAEARVRVPGVRASVDRLLVFMGLALLGVYGLIAVALEALVLPRHVYAPIREMLRADEAARSGDHAGEMIPERMIPGDELGAIMRSRNRTLRQLRQHEADLALALGQLESAANDLRKKNHVIEAAQRNLADADRLASLGVMSAGLAHEMNTPLAVAKGLSERLAARGSLPAEEAALLHRVIGRLEKLGESLLDFARVRPPSAAPTGLRPLVEEAWTLVRLDRQAQRVRLENRVPEGLWAMCDGGRMLQVLVNVLRNAVDATASWPGRGGEGGPGGVVEVEASRSAQGPGGQAGEGWVSLVVRDNGPGIDPAVLGRIFEPFTSTKLDSNGTGLGLAVSQGIVREHGGLLLARNRAGARGAEMEVMLPAAGVNML